MDTLILIVCGFFLSFAMGYVALALVDAKVEGRLIVALEQAPIEVKHWYPVWVALFWPIVVFNFLKYRK